MKKYLAFDGINGGHEDFDTIEEARKWLEECFLDDQEGYHPDFASCMIFQLAETIECDVVDKKENYKYIHEEDVPDDEEGEEVWPYGAGVDEIWKHRFVPVSSELLRQRDELKEALAEQKRLYFSLFDEETSCMYCEAKIRRGSAIILCKECAENTEV